MIDRSELIQLTSVADAWTNPLNEAMALYAITSQTRVEMFLATCLYESTGLTRLTENLNYSAAALVRVWPSRFPPGIAEQYQMRPQMIANRAYANRGGNGDERSGDGWKYRGRGPIQITGKDNYAAAGAAIGMPLAEQPDLLLAPEAGALTAAWFWAENGCNGIADTADFPGTQGVVNRGSRSKLADNMDGRLAWLQKVKSVLG